MKNGFDIDQLDTADEGYMTVLLNGEPTNWVWKFCGPGHPHAVEQSKRVSRDQLFRQRAKEQAQANGKKWKAPEQSPDELLVDNVNFVLERLIDWSTTDGEPITLGGEPYPFTPENARKLLMDRRKSGLLQQAIEFILDDASFIKRSGKNSSTSLSASSG